MSEDSSSDEEWCASADKLPVVADSRQKCWECGKTFQRLGRLISHYKSHDVQATCHICQVTFRRMTSLSTHLDNAHSPFCRLCNRWFSNVWEFNKHTAAHYNIKMSPGTPSNSCVTLHQDENCENSDNGLTDADMAPLSLLTFAQPKEDYTPVVQDHTYISSCGNGEAIQQLVTKQSAETMSEARPLKRGETNHEQLEIFGNHIDYIVGENDFEDINEGNQTDEGESSDDSMSSEENDMGMSVDDRGGRPSHARGDEQFGYAGEKNDKDTSESLHSQSSDSSSEADATSEYGLSPCSSGSSSDSSFAAEHPDSAPTSPHNTLCTLCGRGPFRNVKVHLLHCPGKLNQPGQGSSFHCLLCKGNFATLTLLVEHQRRWYSCNSCGQVFRHWNAYRYHICSKGKQSSTHSIVLFCSQSMPKSCNICNAFFSSEKNLLTHVVTAHSTNFSTIVSKPPPLTDKVAPDASASTAAQLQLIKDVLVSSSAVASQSIIVNGKPPVTQSLATVLRSSPSSPSSSSSHPGLVPVTSTLVNGGASNFTIVQQPSIITQVVPQRSATNPQVTSQTQNTILSCQKITSSSSAVRPLPPILMAVPTTNVRSGTDSALCQVTNQPAGQLYTPLTISVSDSNKTPAAVAAISAPPLTPPLNIVAMFKNDSQEMALQRRMNTSWRCKAPYPCRQCGAISRQPSLIISHRYLHRGRRSHHCKCGRAFKHRLHLLRHCMQHAEATSYICVSCGETFTGAKLLAKHMRGDSRHTSGCTWKHRAKRKCNMPFSCDCGQLFLRPSAYIWHQLKNRGRPKHQKKS